MKILVCIFAPKIIEKSFCNYADAAEVRVVHLHVVGHVGVGGLQSVGVVPAVNKLFFHKPNFFTGYESSGKNDASTTTPTPTIGG